MEPERSSSDRPTQTSADPAPSGPEPLPASPLGTIGAYHLKRVIASGGMGTVYEAVQTQPRRAVAIKVMNRGIASRSALRRFEFEAQVLARLRHPGIAQIYEAATQDLGAGEVPYFAMEYIPNALPLTDYARRRELSVRRRLDLFARVCDAVHHGHQKGIIHRDLKPTNILVDASGQPRIIDFGVARATDSDLAITTLQTDVGQLVGTLQYMSPEQCDADPHALDTRSDVYALGVVLYELLCEQLPYDVRRAAVHEAARVIRESAPARPSTVSRTVRGDVETITLKAMEKDRDRRYHSAHELASDIRRYLRDEPIVARPPSMLYQLRKFARRNRAAVSGGAGVVVVLAAGAVVSGLLAAGQARARREADRQAAVARAVSDFLVETLRSPDPNRLRPDVTVAQVLLDGRAAIDERFADQPAVRLAVHETYARVLRALGLHRPAEEHWRAALEVARLELPADDARRTGLLLGLGAVLLDRGHDVEAGRHIAEALDLLDGAAAPDVEHLIDAEMTAAYRLHDTGDHESAELHYRGALALCRARGADERTGACLTLLGWLLVDAGEPLDAAPMVREGLSLNRRALREPHTQIAFSLMALGHLEQALGDLQAARRAFEESASMYSRLGKPDILPRMLLAGMLEDAGEAGAAPPWGLDELGDLAPSAAIALRNRGRLLHDRGLEPEGDARFRESIHIDQEIDRRAAGSQRSPSIAHTRRVWAGALVRAGREEEALEQYGLALELQRVLPDVAGGDAAAPTLIELGMLHLGRGEAAAACEVLDEALRRRRSSLPEDAWPVATAEAAAARCRSALGRPAEAEALLAHAAAALDAALGPRDKRAARVAAALAALREAGGRAGSDPAPGGPG